MYQVWSQALRTAPNSIVEASVQDSMTRVTLSVAERVFPNHEWDFLTHMAAPEYGYTRFLRAMKQVSSIFAVNIRMIGTQMRFVSALSSRHLLILLRKLAGILQRQYLG